MAHAELGQTESDVGFSPPEAPKPLKQSSVTLLAEESTLPNVTLMVM